MRRIRSGVFARPADEGGTIASLARLASYVDAVAVGLGLFVLLAVFVRADPTSGVTFSVAPFTDESFNIVNARNLVQLGRFSTDEFNLHLVNLPFSVAQAGWMALLGVGLVQARLLMILAVSITAVALAVALRRPLGRWPALFAAVAFATSGLILFYGRLVFLEDVVALALTLGALTLARERPSWQWGVAAGAAFAITIGTKPIGLFPFVGMMAAILIGAWRDRAVRGWALAAIATVAVSGLAWIVAIWLPHRAGVAIDLSIWPPFEFATTPRHIVSYILEYRDQSDGVLGVMLGPLLAAAAAALVVIAIRRRRLAGPSRLLTLAALGWIAGGYGILLLVSYRPSRYVVPLVPAFAILAAIGLHLALDWLRERQEGVPTARRAARPIVAILALCLVALPGLATYAGWMSRPTYDGVGIQNEWAHSVPDGTRVAGPHAAFALMKSRAVTVVTGLANREDQYALGTRWYVQGDTAPSPPGVPADAWAARRTVICSEWRGANLCLYSVP